MTVSGSVSSHWSTKDLHADKSSSSYRMAAFNMSMRCWYPASSTRMVARMASG